jgi:hypothetical protein
MAKRVAVARSGPGCDGEWPKPDFRLLQDGPRPAPPLPLECFGEAAPIIKGLAASKAAPIDYAALSLLVGAAGVIGASRDVLLRRGWPEPSILWGILVGEPAIGKSPPLSAIKDAIDRTEVAYASDYREIRREYETAKVSAIAAQREWEDRVTHAIKKKRPPPIKPQNAELPPEPSQLRLTVDNATVEALARLLVENPRGLLLLQDELAGLIGNWGKYGGDGDAAFYLRAFSGHFGKVDRVTSGRLSATRAYLSILGGIQPDRLQELILSRVNDGLVSRFLVVWPNPTLANFWPTPFDESKLDHIFGRLVALQPKTDASGKTAPKRIPFTGEAQGTFATWYIDQSNRAIDEAGFIAEFLGKSRGACARLAFLLEHLDWAVGTSPLSSAPRKVTPDAVERACTLYDQYFEPMARRVYADAGRTTDERCAIALLKVLRDRREHSFNARIALREWGISGIRKSDEMDRACATLVEARCIRLIEPEGGGRPPKNYLVNPRIWAANKNASKRR